jgi:Helix-turn-helix
VQRNPAIEATNDFSDATASALAAIGIRIKEIRLARGMTLQTVSDESGLSPSMLSLVERGRASPSKTAALRDFSPVYVRFGSSSTKAGGATRPCTSASSDRSVIVMRSVAQCQNPTFGYIAR